MLTARELSEKQDRNIQSVVQNAITSIICKVINPHLESAISNNTQKSLKLDFYLEEQYHRYRDEILATLRTRLSALGYTAQIYMNINQERTFGKRGTRNNLTVLFNCDIKW